MNNTWDEYAADWDANRDAIEYSEKAFHCLTEVASIEGAEVFDFGCGTGLLTEKLSPLAKTVVSLDTSQKMIEGLAGKNLPNVIPICETLSALLNLEIALYQSRFDLVVASSVCAFVPDYEEVLLQLKSLLKQDGLFVQWDWFSSAELSGPGFTEKQISDALEKAVFRSVTVSTGFSISAPEGDAPVLMAVARK